MASLTCSCRDCGFWGCVDGIEVSVDVVMVACSNDVSFTLVLSRRLRWSQDPCPNDVVIRLAITQRRCMRLWVSRLL